MRSFLISLLSLTLFACKDNDKESGAPETGDTSESAFDDLDQDGYDASEDCDDGDASVNPGAVEACNDIDDDCDGDIDDGAGSTWYTDADGDGYGDDASAVQACEQPADTLSQGGDCDDTDPAYNPAAREDDCDDPADYNCDGSTGYEDGDNDGYAACGDCDDADAQEYPGATEICDGDDDDCDGEADEIGAYGGATWYRDQDEDGYGDADITATECAAPEGYVADNTDCLDNVDTVNPGATETCDDLDNNCDGEIDEAGAEGEASWYADGDGDGYGDASVSAMACDAPAGYVAYDTDCDDTDADYNPAAVESCEDPEDYNCDGSVGYADGDGDGFAACEECDDASADINPDASETCDGSDNDCDGTIDEDDAIDASAWYADADGDLFGDASRPRTSCAAPDDHVADDTDCDDTSADVFPGADELCDGEDGDCDGVIDEDALDADTWYSDADGDGYGDDDGATSSCEAPSDSAAVGGDCDDTDEAVSPGADELCNEVDDNCDTYIDNSALDAGTWYADADADGFGDPGVTALACDLPDGYSADAEDCDDEDSAVNPDADELCDSLDNDCDGSSDEEDAIDGETWYADADADGYGDAASTTTACSVPEGYTDDATDCDDADVAINPAADETCNTYDDDCDGEVDEAGSSGELGTWYRDADDDGYGDPSDTTEACEQPSGYVKLGTDCDDGDDGVNPGAADVCDELDNDCSGVADDGADGLTWYVDGDGDGYGEDTETVLSCEMPSGYAATADDCDDADDAVNPGADELCNDADDDCDGTADDSAVDATTWYKDADKDGYGKARSSRVQCDKPGVAWVADDNTDCNDTVASINPGADEVCDSLDNDCDGSKDEDATDVSVWYADADDDGYGDASRSTTACDLPSGYTDLSTDCDDGDDGVNPGADELCDDTDNDCDSAVDEDAIDEPTWYLDNDEDGFGVTTRTTEACDMPSGYADNTDDCDDFDEDVSPDADEVCDGEDNDCDSSVDEGTTGVGSWYADMDGDGYGDPADSEASCAAPDGYVADDEDCDDADDTVNPGASERCNEVDDDCDGDIDEAGALGGTSWYADEDGDGDGDPARSQSACEMPDGYVDSNGDCDDEDLTVYSGADEVCGDGIVNDCEGTESDALESCALDGSYSISSAAWASFYGETSPDYTGFAVAGPGDLNGDGNDDLLIAASRDSNDKAYAGAVYVWEGPVTGSFVNSESDAVFRGESGGDEAGQSVAGAGDLDGDGYPDVMVAAPKADLDASTTSTGSTYLLFAPFAGTIDLGSADAELTGEARGDVAGRSVQPAGDWDGDGTLDVAIGAAGDDTSGDWAGKAYVQLGPVSGVNSLSTAALELTGEATYDYAGRWMAGGEDLNGDGSVDLVVGANGEDTGGATAGAVYVVYGPLSGTVSLSEADVKLTGEAAGDQAGRSVALVDDSDGDGLPEVLIGAWASDRSTGSNPGSAYLFSGLPSGTASVSTADTIFTGAARSDNLGIGLDGAGDTDGDGAADLVLGAQGVDTGASNAGAAYLFYGPFAAGVVSASTADATLLGTASTGLLGWGVTGAGDTNGDGLDDLLLGSHSDDTVGTDVGSAWLIGGGF